METGKFGEAANFVCKLNRSVWVANTLPPLVAIAIEVMNWLDGRGNGHRNRVGLLFQICETPLFVQEKMNKTAICANPCRILDFNVLWLPDSA